MLELYNQNVQDIQISKEELNVINRLCTVIIFFQNIS